MNSTLLRSDWKDIQNVIDHNNITALYHFTDRSNINSIVAKGGLLSLRAIDERKVNVPCPGGSDVSHSLDRRKRLDNYVRLSFAKDHPMKHVAMSDGRIDDPVVLEIDPRVIYHSSTKFSDCNAAKNGATVNGSLDLLRSLRYDVFDSKYFNLSDDEKSAYQAEVLVEGSVPLCYIRNIRDFYHGYIDSDRLVTPEEVELEREVREEVLGVIKDQEEMLNEAVSLGVRATADGELCSSIRIERGQRALLSWDGAKRVKSLYVNGEKCTVKDGEEFYAVSPRETTTYTFYFTTSFGYIYWPTAPGYSKMLDKVKAELLAKNPPKTTPCTVTVYVDPSREELEAQRKAQRERDFLRNLKIGISKTRTCALSDSVSASKALITYDAPAPVSVRVTNAKGKVLLSESGKSSGQVRVGSHFPTHYNVQVESLAERFKRERTVYLNVPLFHSILFVIMVILAVATLGVGALLAFSYFC